MQAYCGFGGVLSMRLRTASPAAVSVFDIFGDSAMTTPSIPARDRIFAGEDQKLYLHVGYFQTWFAACERNIAFLLARATNSRDLVAFELLTKGLDARGKTEKLRTAMKRRGGFGPNLDTRLSTFEKVLIGTRNRLSHSAYTHPSPGDKLYMTSLANMPSFSKSEQGWGSPIWISFDDLFYQGLWLNYFNDDLHNAQAPDDASPLEIENPRSPPRPDDP